MTPFVTMRRALSDEHLLGVVLGGDSWLAWRILLIAAMGEPLTDEERTIFAKLTGREREPGERVDELWCVIGRRGGKSRAVAALLVCLATRSTIAFSWFWASVASCCAWLGRKSSLRWCLSMSPASSRLRQSWRRWSSAALPTV